MPCCSSTTTQVETFAWEQILNYAAERPLLHLRLVSRKPADAARLMTPAQRLGAEGLSAASSRHEHPSRLRRGGRLVVWTDGEWQAQTCGPGASDFGRGR